MMSDGTNMDTKHGAKLIDASEGGMQSKSKYTIQSPRYTSESGLPKPDRRSKGHACLVADESIPLSPNGSVCTRR